MKLRKLSPKKILIGVLLLCSAMSATVKPADAATQCEAIVSELGSYLPSFDFKVRSAYGDPVRVHVAVPAFRGIQCQFKGHEDSARYYGKIRFVLPEKTPIEVTYYNEATKKIDQIENHRDIVMEYGLLGPQGGYKIDFDFQTSRDHHPFHQILALKDFLIDLPGPGDRSLEVSYIDGLERSQRIELPKIPK